MACSARGRRRRFGWRSARTAEGRQAGSVPAWAALAATAQQLRRRRHLAALEQISLIEVQRASTSLFGSARSACCSLPTADPVAVCRQFFRFSHLGLGRPAPAPRARACPGSADLSPPAARPKAVHRLAVHEHHAKRDAAHAEHLRQLSGDLGLLVGCSVWQPAGSGPAYSASSFSSTGPSCLARAAPGAQMSSRTGLLAEARIRPGFEVLRVMSIMVGADEGRLQRKANAAA